MTQFRLSTYAAVATGILVILIGLMLSRFLFLEWQAVSASADGLWTTKVAHKAMVAVEKASFERGPSNGLLGDSYPPAPAIRDRLQQARKATDDALQDLREAIRSNSCSPDCTLARHLDDASERLRMARQTVDQVSSLPRQQRSAAAVTGAVHQMFDIIPGLMHLTTELSRTAINIDPNMGPAFFGALSAVELREYAGRLGSQFTAALTGQKPLTASERKEIYILGGRIEQLRDLIHVHTETLDANAAVKPEAVKAMEEGYFRGGLEFVRQIERASAEGRPYGVSTTGFAARYVPYMNPIVQVRDAMMQTAIEAAEERHAAALENLIVAMLLGAATLVLVTLLLMAIRGWVVKPLLKVTHAVVELAHGNLNVALPTGSSREIAELQNALAVLKTRSIDKCRMEDQLRKIIESIPGVFYLLDHSGHFLMWNRNLETVLGLTAEEVGRSHSLDFFDEREKPRVDHTIRSVFETGEASIEAVLLTKNGGHSPYFFNGYRFELDNGPTLIGVGIDIGDKVRAVAEAERLANLRSAFMAQMNHELRTPLNGILGFTQLIQKKDELPGEVRDWLGVIHDNGEHLLALINQVLDFAKIEAGKLPLDFTDIRLVSFLEAVIATIRVDAEKKRLAFAISLAPDLPTFVRTDALRLRQILLNLLSNAVKFTDQGRVELRVVQLVPGRLRFEVSDSGLGIAAEKQDRIFEPFEQIEDAARIAEGTGLGLAISRKLAQLMGGDIAVESRMGEGSCFSMELDMTVEAVGAQTPTDADIVAVEAQEAITEVEACALPAATELEQLLELARQGYLSRIIRRATELEAAHAAFAGHLGRLAKTYRSKAVEAYLQRCRERQARQ